MKKRLDLYSNYVVYSSMERERKTNGTESKDWFSGFILIKPAVS